MGKTPRVAVIMGSDSDWPIMKDAAEVLELAGVEVFRDIVSAHRTPEKMMDFASNCKGSRIPGGDCWRRRGCASSRDGGLSV